MASNTKLTSVQKQQLRDMKVDFPQVNFLHNTRDLVCAYYSVGNHIRFAFAVKSEDEIKFRRKVGELCAMERVLPDWTNECTLLPESYFWYMVDVLELDSNENWKV